MAVAANFLAGAETLAAAYEAETGVAWEISHGATGGLATQIARGAPFDLFLAADMVRPELLRGRGDALAVKPYALGQLVLVLPEGSEAAPLSELLAGRRVAIADPALAPYGAAAVAALEAAGVQVGTLDLVRGPNVGATASFFALGTVDAAFIAASQVADTARHRALIAVPVDPATYPEIAQGAALLSGDADARAAYDWLSSDAARALIGAAGYALPEWP